jgi:hypothetical protein
MSAASNLFDWPTNIASSQRQELRPDLLSGSFSARNEGCESRRTGFFKFIERASSPRPSPPLRGGEGVPSAAASRRAALKSARALAHSKTLARRLRVRISDKARRPTRNGQPLYSTLQCLHVLSVRIVACREGCFAKRASSPRPSPPLRGGEGEERSSFVESRQTPPTGLHFVEEREHFPKSGSHGLYFVPRLLGFTA